METKKLSSLPSSQNEVNEADVREGLLKILPVADMFIDSELVDWVSALIKSDTVWDIVYGLTLDLFDGYKESGNVLSDTQKDDLVCALGDDPKLDPALIIALIEIAMKLFDWWKNRN